MRESERERTEVEGRIIERQKIDREKDRVSQIYRQREVDDSIIETFVGDNRVDVDENKGV